MYVKTLSQSTPSTVKERVWGWIFSRGSISKGAPAQTETSPSPGAVDDHLAEGNLPPGGVLHDDALRHDALFQHIDGQGMEEEIDARLLHHLKHEEAPPVRVDVGEGVPGPPRRLLVRQGMPLLEEARMGLLP